jgi:hypothetical protein
MLCLHSSSTQKSYKGVRHTVMGWSDSAACNDKIMFLYKPLSCLGTGSLMSIETGGRCVSDTDISSSKSGTTSIRLLQYKHWICQ